MKYDELILPIVRPINHRLFLGALLMAIVGLLICLLAVFTLEVGTTRTVLIFIGLPMLALPVVMRLFIPEHKKIGIVRFAENEILMKFGSHEPQIFEAKNIHNIKFNIEDYHGESRFSDMFMGSTHFTIRSGDENFVSWESNGEKFHVQFKLSTELQMKKVDYFLKMLQRSYEI
jgi:hypothetical protein